MSDLPVSLLTQQAHARPISGEELEMLGKAAAARYTSTGTPLTQAVVETVKHAGLGPEQVRRVAEFTNIEAYLKAFEKCGGDHRYVQFQGGPADVPTILKDLNDGGGGTVFDRGVMDYYQPPPDLAKVAERNIQRLDPDDAKLAAMFGVEEKPLPYEEPLREAHDLYTAIGDAQNKVAFDLSELESQYFDVVDAIYVTVKQAALEGTPLGHVVQAWSTVTDDPELMKVAFAAITPRLLSDQVFLGHKALADSIEKTASNVLVNPEHELVQNFRFYCETIEKMAGLRVARDELLSARDSLGTFLREMIIKTAAATKMDALANAAEHGASTLRSGWQGATRAAEAASGPAGRIGEALGGPLAGKALGAAVKYAPHAGAALLAEDVYQHARYSPAFQAAKNSVLARVPYTQPYMARQYDLQTRGGL